MVFSVSEHGVAGFSLYYIAVNRDILLCWSVWWMDISADALRNIERGWEGRCEKLKAIIISMA